MLPDKYAVIGSDPRWLIGGPKTLCQLLTDVLGEDEGGEILAQAVALIRVARQIAVRRAVADGIETAYSVENNGRGMRESIRRAVQAVTGLEKDQANRILRGVGHFPGDDGGIHRSTLELFQELVRGDRAKSVRELNLDLVMSLALASGEQTSRFLLEPFEFAANTAATLLKLRVTGTDQMTEFDAQEETARSFPLLSRGLQAGVVGQRRLDSPEQKMAIYGLYLWQAGIPEVYGESRDILPETDLCAETVQRVIRWGCELTRWVFPHIDPSPSQITAARKDSSLHEHVMSCVRCVASEVGQALCGVGPYCREIPERTMV